LSPYADTSFLFSLYLADANTPAALRFRLTINGPLPLTAFHRVELRNAMALAVFRRQITIATAQAAWNDVETDLQSGALDLLVLHWPDVFREAEHLAAQHSSTTGNRSLDVLHVAAARLMGRVDFVTFDTRQAALGKQIGFAIKP
jgi:predicted nucleic acid-binding protein